MPRGLYLEKGWVMVDYSPNLVPIPVDEYIAKGYEPEAAFLPSKDEYEEDMSPSM
jgi:hypothetical protein